MYIYEVIDRQHEVTDDWQHRYNIRKLRRPELQKGGKRERVIRDHILIETGLCVCVWGGWVCGQRV